MNIPTHTLHARVCTHCGPGGGGGVLGRRHKEHLLLLQGGGHWWEAKGEQSQIPWGE